MAITTFQRYEKKFLLSESQYKSIYPGLMQYLCLDGNCMDGQGYSIYNIYYDTDSSSIIRSSLSKPYYKEKFRLRSYSLPKSLNSKVFLELKKKIGGIVNKRRAVLTLGEAYNFLKNGRRPLNMDYMNTQVLNEIEFFLQTNAVKPAAYISYDRIALFSKDGSNFRITFDNNIITRREDLSMEKGRFGKDLLEPGKFLMEVKVPGAFPMWLANLLSDNQIYQTSFSKYGREYMHNLLSNRAEYRLNIAV